MIRLELIIYTIQNRQSLVDYLSKNKTVKVVCNNLTSSALNKSEGYIVDTSRIVAITPELYKYTEE